MMEFPKNSGFQIGEKPSMPALRDVRSGHPVEELPGVRVEERAVGVEAAVLDGDRDLEVGLVRREGIAHLRRGTGQDGRTAGALVDDGRVAILPATEEEEAGGTRVDVEPGHPQGVVVVPDRRGAVEVGVLERREPGTPRRAVGDRRPGLEEPIPGALGGVAGRDVPGRRQVPGFRVAVALVADADGAVDVGHHRDRPAVPARRRPEHRARVAPFDSAGWVRPVQRRIDGQEVRQVVAAGRRPGR